MRIRTFVLVISMITVTTVNGQYFDKSIDAIVASKPPVIDGSLDDHVWKTAAVITDLHQLEPEEYGSPTESTEYRVLYDTENLYVSARLHYSDISMLTANVMTPRQRVFLEDRIVIMLDPFMSRRNGYLFESNAYGIQGDALLENNSQRINEWTGVFEVATSIDDDGWSIEFRIPFSTISFDPQREDWGFNVYRDLKRTQERLAWSSKGRQELTEAPAAAGTLRGLKGLKPGLGLDLVPSVSLKSQKDFGTGLDNSSFEPSLDVTYRMTPSLTAKLTLNTDFSATEVDDLQVNLTRFSLFFPEKRDFFLQDAGIFEFAKLQGNGRPFFSRNIGLSPDGDPLNLNAGLKMTGRIGDWNIGFLGTEQEASATLGPRKLFVGRAVANVFNESSVGLMVTDGDAQNNRDAQTLGLDFRYRNSKFLGNRIFQGELWYQQTNNQPIPGTVASSTGSDESAWGVHALLPNDHHRFDAWYYQFGKNFDPALGFVNRPGIKDLYFNYRHRKRQVETAWQWHDQQFAFRQIKSTYNSELTETMDLVPWKAQTRKSDLFQVYVKREREVLEEGFSLFDRIPVQPGSYEYTRYGAYAETARYRVLQAGISAEFGDFLDGTREKFGVELRWKPSARFNFSLGYETNKIQLPSGKFTARVMSLKSEIAFNTKWSFTPLFQFDNVSEELGTNLRLRYHPMRGSDFFFVWSRSMLRDINDRFQSTFQESVVKGTYTFRF